MLHLDYVHLGEHSAIKVHEIERGAVSKFARALTLTDPIYFSREAAQSQGYRHIVAPPTFVVTLLPWDIPGLTLPEAGVIHGEQEFEWGEPICVTDAISVSGWVDEVKSRSGRGGQMTIITVASEGEHADGRMAFRARAVLIVTEAVDHGSR